MGCDIHLHIEVKIGGTWHHYSAPSVDRWYDLFERMAGVRGDVEKAICAPRGLPQDMSVVTACSADKWKGDAHSLSWLDSKEIAGLAAWAEANLLTGYGRRVRFEMDVTRGYLFGHGYDEIVKYPEDLPEWLEDVRFVFWFDN